MAFIGYKTNRKGQPLVIVDGASQPLDLQALPAQLFEVDETGEVFDDVDEAQACAIDSEANPKINRIANRASKLHV